MENKKNSFKEENKMKKTKIRWQFKGQYEDYDMLFEDKTHILVQSERSKKYSFGVKGDFGSCMGFPTNWSCLTAVEALEVLNGLIAIENKPPHLGDITKANIARWNAMIAAIRHEDEEGAEEDE